MMEGLGYHYDNFHAMHGTLFKGSGHRARSKSFEKNKKLIPKIKHEIVAYINRAGQFYYFAESDFVLKKIPNISDQIGTIKKLYDFRRKQTAHRSLDAPHDEDHVEGRKYYLEVLMGPGTLTNSKGNLCLQLCLDETIHDFDLESEHELVMEEAYNVIKSLMGA